MNKEYIYIDGKVIICDENNKKTLSGYYDNLDEVLAQENLIEMMEKKIQELEKERTSYKKNSHKHYVPVILPTSVLMSTLGTMLLEYLLIGPDAFTTSVDTIFGTMSNAMSLCIPVSICTVPVAALFEHIIYSSYKSSIKYEKGINSQLDFLKNQIEKEKEKLKRLEQDKSREKESKEFRTVKVNDSQKLDTLNDNLNYYYDLGSINKTQREKEDREEKGHPLVLRKRNNNRNS